VTSTRTKAKKNGRKKRKNGNSRAGLRRTPRKFNRVGDETKASDARRNKDAKNSCRGREENQKVDRRSTTSRVRRR